MWNDEMAQPFVSSSLQIRSMPSPNSLTYLYALRYCVILGLQKLKGTRSNLFGRSLFPSTPSILRVLSETPMPGTLPSTLTIATMGIANALGSICMLLQSNVWHSLQAGISSVVMSCWFFFFLLDVLFCLLRRWYLWRGFKANEVVRIHIEQLGSLHHGLKRRLCRVGTMTFVLFVLPSILTHY